MIKVPATATGIAAIHQLIIDGANVNKILLFSVQYYREVTQPVLSVASLFLSRIDTLVGRELDALAHWPLQKKYRHYAAGPLSPRRARPSMNISDFSPANVGNILRQQGLLLNDCCGRQCPPRIRLVVISNMSMALIGSNTINHLPHDALATYRDYGEHEGVRKFYTVSLCYLNICTNASTELTMLSYGTPPDTSFGKGKHKQQSTKESNMNDIKMRIDEMVNDLKQTRDELQVKLQLAKLEVGDEWKKLEEKLVKLEAKTRELGSATAEASQDIGAAAKLLGEEIHEGFKKIGKHF